MATPTKTRRNALREALIVIAETQIAAGGIAGLRARDLATEAGCALGAIYNVFPDLTALTLEVNARTFADLGQDVAEALAQAATDPTAQMVTMGLSYHRFAATHRNRWRALFDVTRAAGSKPLLGSSSTSNCGAGRRAFASSTRRRRPPLNVDTRSEARGVSPNRSRARSIPRSSADFDNP